MEAAVLKSSKYHLTTCVCVAILLKGLSLNWEENLDSEHLEGHPEYLLSLLPPQPEFR